jgi:transposase
MLITVGGQSCLRFALLEFISALQRLFWRTPHRGRRIPWVVPDFNPIENAFAKLKALPRRAGERSVEGLWHLIGKLIVDAFSPQECATYFAAAGYDPD